MSDDGFMSGKVEYIQKLAHEVAGLKGVLQDITQQVRRIERRIDYALPHEKQDRANKSRVSTEQAPTMSELQARQTIKRMTQHIIDEKPLEDIQAELRGMNVKRELTPIAREFGMTNTALPPKTKLVLNIITRLRQTEMLTRNTRKMSRVAEEEERFGN